MIRIRGRHCGDDTTSGGGYLLYFLRNNPISIVGLSIVLSIALVTVIAPWIVPYDPRESIPGATLQPPSSEHWFGTDNQGLDVLSALRFGVDLALLEASAADVVDAVTRTSTLMRDAGARRRDVMVPDARRADEVFLTIQRAEAACVHRRVALYPERAGAYGADVAERLADAQSTSVDDLASAMHAREELRAQALLLFREIDVLLTPVVPGPPLRIGEDSNRELGASFRQRVLPFTVLQSLAGLPACSVPAGFDGAGLPLAVQLTGAPLADSLVLGVAEEVSDLRDVGALRPPLGLSAA